MKYLYFPFLLIIALACTEQSEKICQIEGKIVDRDSEAIIIQKAHEGTYPDYLKTDYEYIRIPITDNSFSYEFQFDDVVAYKLIFEEELVRSWLPIEFFPVDGRVEMTLHPSERFSENIIIGSKLSNDFTEIESTLGHELEEVLNPLYDSINALREDDLYFSDSMKIFMAQHNIEDEYSHNGDRHLYNQLTKLTDSGVAFSDMVNAIKEQIANERKKNRMQLYEVMEERNDILSYYLLFDKLRTFNPQTDDIERLASLQKDLSKKFENHPYNKLSEDLLWSKNNTRIGGNYYDFTLPDFNQNNHTLSEEIKDQFTLLLIWAPWCGPCIKSNREMVPVYEKYKDNGLKAVAVVGKYKNLEQAEKIITKENNPWLHLLDSEWDSEVWRNYGLLGSGGSIFLIDNKGKIRSVYPGAEEVDRILSAAWN